MAKVAKCPTSGCDGIGVPIDTKKKFSLGKSLIGNTVGGLAFGPVGALVGAAAGIKGKNDKTSLVCPKCGTIFEMKI